MLEHPNEQTIFQFLTESLAQVQSDQVAFHLESCFLCQKIAEKMIDRVAPTGCISKPSAHSSQINNAINHQGIVEADSSLDDSPPQIPRNRFLIIEELARGGMGIVYRGFDRALKRQVAIKVPRQNHRESNTYRLCREADISSQLQHPGVVPIYERGQLVDGRPYLAMQLIEGKTLLELIRASDSNQLELLRVFGDIVQTMAYAHSLNYVHRDLKPQNVMIGKFGVVKIIDWGLAKRLDPNKEIRQPDSIADRQTIKRSSGNHPRTADRLVGDNRDFPSTRTAADGIAPGETQIGAIMGSHGYMSPEQSQGHGVSKRSDVFAIGGILFQILTGHAPCATQTAQEEFTSTNVSHEAREHKLSRPLIELDDLDCAPKIIEICKACLSEDPFGRPQDAQAIKARLGHDFYLRISAEKVSIP